VINVHVPLGEVQVRRNNCSMIHHGIVNTVRGNPGGSAGPGGPQQANRWQVFFHHLAERGINLGPAWFRVATKDHPPPQPRVLDQPNFQALSTSANSAEPTPVPYAPCPGPRHAGAAAVSAVSPAATEAAMASVNAASTMSAIGCGSPVSAATAAATSPSVAFV
jgi:hypothetical protein